ncbi:unnamed protein product, partial [marine sediment metagenome]
MLPLLFANYLSKSSILVIGGYDTANLPEADYGHQRGGMKKWLSRLTMHLASCLITFSNYSREESEMNAALPPTKVQVIYLGLPDTIGQLPVKPPLPMVLTVGNVEKGNLMRKGLEPFVLAAHNLPGIPFVLVGKWRD